jgi:hypothetical protein
VIHHNVSRPAARNDNQVAQKSTSSGEAEEIVYNFVLKLMDQCKNQLVDAADVTCYCQYQSQTRLVHGAA